MDPWYKIALPRQEVREGRSFDPDEFAIALEQVVFDPAHAPEDYSKPEKFFARTYFTRALVEHVGTVLRRLSGQTVNAAPVLTFITQFGGGKTHTLTTLYHLASNGPKAAAFPGVRELLAEIGLSEVPLAKVGVFVGNAWDPREGRETPWIDLARQVAGEAGVKALGPSAATVPPGTESLTRVFADAGRPVLLLLDEVLNFINRHRAMADGLYAFVQNLTVAAAGAPNVSAVLSLPKSTVEMTNWDAEWQTRIGKVVRRVAKDLIVNEESEVSEVVRRRLFESLGDEKIRRKIAKTYADWCFERRAQLPAHWTAADVAATEGKARDVLYRRFDACYPFHSATLSVFQRKWQTLPLFQQTRGTLRYVRAMALESLRRTTPHGLARTVDHLGLGSAGGQRFSREHPRRARRAEAQCGDRGRYLRSDDPCGGLGCRFQGLAAVAPYPRRDGHPVRKLGRDRRTSSPISRSSVSRSADHRTSKRRSSTTPRMRSKGRLTSSAK